MDNQKKRFIEVFTAGCMVCDSAVELVKKLACSSCEVLVYNLASPCESQECLQKAKAYGVTALPAIAVNGVLLDCCRNTGVSEKALAQAGVGIL